MAWSADPWLPSGETSSELPDIVPMQRRRLSRLGKMAVAVTSGVSHVTDMRVLPIVWASRYGDAHRSLEMLAQHAKGDAVSPTSFAVSVHNGIGAQYSIAKSITQNATSIAAGATTAEAGLIEAVALLADGHPEVIVVHYDALLPEAYAQYHDGPMTDYAWALRIARARPDSNYLSLSTQETSPQGDVAKTLLPPGLEVLKFLLSDAPRLVHQHQSRAWIWSRHHG